MGICLLSTLTAHDLGYLSLTALVERLEKIFETFDNLERFHGHFYNWYDTLTLKVLHPAYVSTVDSGNFLASLLALKQGLREKIDAPVCGPALRDGLADTLRLVAESFHAIEPPKADTPALFPAIERALGELAQQLHELPADLLGWDRWLEALDHRAEELVAQVKALAEAIEEVPDELYAWADRLAQQLRNQRDELAGLAPWLKRFRAGQPAVSPELTRLLLTPGSVADLEAQREAALEQLAASHLPLTAALTSAALELRSRLQQLADRANALANGMDFRLLYNHQRDLFSIGYNAALGRLDNAHYDLLASEACLTSFLAVARGDVPRRHWFQLGRQITRAAGGIALLSWGGTMFEYLMPRLFLRPYPGTLLDEARAAVVARQIEYGTQCRVPWGISESGYSALDAALDYQYQSFGVPGLGLKRGLSNDLVIAPYATALALMVRPHAALANFRALTAERGEGPYGYYEAIDYTRDRLLEKRRSAAVRSFMAHHQGMSLLAAANCLLGDPLPRRFHAEPMVRATELLLQERVPRIAPLVEPHGDESATPAVQPDGLLPMSRRLTTPNTPHPRTHLLSNGQYTVLVTNAGASYSTWRDLDVTRWREDRTTDAWGQFFYIRDLRSGLLWSAGYQPVGRTADQYEVVYSTDKAEFHRSDAGIETHLEITVSPEHGAEVRRLSLTNHNPRLHELEVTSYAEVVLNPHRADLAHPAFGKLFLETEFVLAEEALLCRRRPRSADQKPIWAVHVLTVEGTTVGGVQYETDRARFLGRGRTPAQPAALEAGAILSGTTGPVLDPVFSLRRRVRIAPGASVALAFTTAVATSREEALALADQYHDVHGVTRAFELAWAHSQVQLRHLHLSAGDAHLFQRLAAQVIYTGPTLRAPADLIKANHQGQTGLWRHGISGDRPIVLVRIAEHDDVLLVRQLLQAHAYWRLQGLEVDLVLLYETPTGYRDELFQEIQNLIRTSDSHALADKPGGVFLRKADQMAPEDRTLLQAAARVVLVGSRGSLAGQVDQRPRAVGKEQRSEVRGQRSEVGGRRSEVRGQGDESSDKGQAGPAGLLFANGLGGFSPDGREYVLAISARKQGRKRHNVSRPSDPWRLAPDPSSLPPAPWINVIANPVCGFLVSETGAGYTWVGNSQLNRLTPWSNDPVSDPPGEVLYLRDEASGAVWTPTPLPRGSGGVVRHGQGYTIFEQVSHGLHQELLLLVPPTDPLKLLRLTVRNFDDRPRRLSATYYAEWVLGTVRDAAPMQVITELDEPSGALLARNAFNPEYPAAVAFADVSLRPRSFTADRTEFLGRNGSVRAPAALERGALAGQVGATLDPCAALMAPFELQPGEEKEIVFVLGQTTQVETVRRLLEAYRQPGRVGAVFDEVRRRWDQVLTAVQVRTPDTGMDLLLNRWLPYQVLGCRLWGRSAFYQSGGAYGFRDQLQDVMALVYGAPEETRAQLLRAASRQFLEGDVQHWWHPPTGRGVRTRISDDFLWLPLVACHYVTTTGDYAILDEPVSWLRAPLLQPSQEEDYGLPDVTEEKDPLYEHCVRAIEHGLRFGPHGLPLMGTGDWNDGMNRVGAEGKGESIWNGWFLITVLRRFADLAESRRDTARAARYWAEAERLRQAMEAHAWDGAWYRRAYFDDGMPLGSAQNDECQIDSLAQTWAVISRGAEAERARQAMAAVDRLLVRDREKLILLFTPPFDQGPLHPGYIKGYVPGIRENGGQYTHGATWVVLAMALLGQGKRAAELFGLLNPIHHGSSPQEVARYRIEPYVVAGDVYGAPPHTGRGGWSWYTGSASWLYRVALEAILGFQREGDVLRMRPCIPASWPGYELTYKYGSATYHIHVRNPHHLEQGTAQVSLVDDGREHAVDVVLEPPNG
jgi:cyclic beta-1,2-glucan synthetase